MVEVSCPSASCQQRLYHSKNAHSRSPPGGQRTVCAAIVQALCSSTTRRAVARPHGKVLIVWLGSFDYQRY
ncbi:hypothetical protein F442_08365 [Phytophthora nicotianae P10297]|uniref:Uncharacterized protein n=4 Tax=Phytophthora nicotianae TaxID=4792 RepID=W2QAT7_PHYN3|nr:hypothetical protein PPTG_22872 [Phytophthora nicotianae INRA-310]ETI47358.1 hypothetical protein F443_08428 [Phytophthora nicotianae P1569]ETK87279.1 hypothetical protein L915_08259 [Phytophthora nicotianae]ETP45204.1 hypothetical protein F442_08365 [Phytophthora nicotianae P10297]ETL93853.1 hypothetical protein L917_08081 [Phytophthora nicotianae]ETM47106.1 hypothetical protein L914_08146 [Phytophthora nicotianae]